MEKKSVKICNECNKAINLSVDKYVLLGTYYGDDPRDEGYFHLKCFNKWYNQRVSEKAKNNVSMIQSKMQSLMANPQIAGMLENIGGVDKLKQMLDTNLSSQIEEAEEMFEDKKNDDGKPKRKKTSKKM